MIWITVDREVFFYIVSYLPISTMSLVTSILLGKDSLVVALALLYGFFAEMEKPN